MKIPDAAERERIAAEVRAERIAQGLPPELTDEQLDAIGAIWASRPRKGEGES